MNLSELTMFSLRYSDRGLPIFPIRPLGKVPLTAHGVKDATTDRVQVSNWWREWPEANIGLATGVPSGYYVIDLDGPEGEAAWGALCRQNGEAPTLTAKTGGGGTHLYYELPHGVDLGNTAKKLGPGIDTRGTGGYVLMPPSVTSGQYSWRGGRSALLPQWVLAALRRTLAAPPEARQMAVRARAEEDNDLALRILDEECNQIRGTAEGSRNDQLFIGAAKILSLAWGGEIQPITALYALRDAGLAAGLAPREVEATIESANKHAKEQPRRIKTRLETDV